MNLLKLFPFAPNYLLRRKPETDESLSSLVNAGDRNSKDSGGFEPSFALACVTNANSTGCVVCP
jgi:hypothetical protein